MARFTLPMVLVIAALAAHPAKAGEFNRKLDVGQTAPVWSKLPGVDDKDHSLADLKDKDAVIVVFTCNHCPVAQDYEDRLVEFASKYSKPDSKAAVVAICVSRLEEDTLPRMKERAQKKGFAFPYIRDASQRIGRAYGATVTPEFFVLDRDRKIAYMGRMDDNLDPAKVKSHDLEDAVQAILKGKKPARAETSAIGCSVEYEKNTGK